MQETLTGPQRFLNYPTNRTIGFFDSPGLIRPFMKDITRLGFEKHQIQVLMGENGINAVDEAGDYHGLYARWLRLSQRFFHTGEWELIELADSELRQGHCLVAVTTFEDEERDQVVKVMRKYGGHDIKYFSPWYVEHFPDLF